ncbi:MAG TPA: glycosyltransferase family 2 protein [Gammaproteobacteria bacterium]|nr:glycosyltransferase family 2 protein [Gammaproteobacteria bacterium]
MRSETLNSIFNRITPRQASYITTKKEPEMEMGQILSIGRQKPNRTLRSEAKPEHDVKASIDYCASLMGRYLIITGWAYHPNEEIKAYRLDSNKHAISESAYTVLRGQRKDVADHLGVKSDALLGFSIIATMDGVLSEESELSLIIDSSSGRTAIDVSLQKETSLRPLLDLHMRSFDPKSKSALLNQCISLFKGEIVDLSESLNTPLESIGAFVRIQIEKAINISNAGVFLYGWLIDSESDLDGIYLQHESEISNNILESLYTFSRDDVIRAFEGHTKVNGKYGILCYVPLDIESGQPKINMMLTTKRGKLATIGINISSITSTTETIEHILVNVDLKDRNLFDCLESHIHPALQMLRQYEPTDWRAEVISYGDIPDAPECSVIVPIYGRYDFVLYQNSQFFNDPDFSNVDLIYVLDDPSIRDEFYRYCESVHQTFRLPFRTVYAGNNRGFAGANNVGVDHAIADRVILLNSDIIPDTPLWVSKMLKAYNELDNPGIIGARLLFEDNTVQHAGLAYMQFPQGGEFHFNGMWWIDHPSKGLPQSMVETRGTTSVPAVTGACMLVAKSIYNEVGGMDESYILGDFEDSDLCLKINNAGYTNYLLDDLILFHLERQSQNLFAETGWKFKLTVYNGWQHSKRWGQKIAEINAAG